MNYAGLTVQRPELCKACLAGTGCSRAAVRNGMTCLATRELYDAGYASALTKIQSAIDAARQKKKERVPGAPIKRRSRRRRTTGKLTDTELKPDGAE
jgi:hypothetical protein